MSGNAPLNARERAARERVIFALAQQHADYLRDAKVAADVACGMLLGSAFHLIARGHHRALADMLYAAADRAAAGDNIAIDLGVLIGKGRRNDP